MTPEQLASLTAPLPEPNTKPVPTITIPITEYLEHIWAYASRRNKYLDNFVVLSRAEVDRILSAVPNDVYCHIEFPEGGDGSLAHVYQLSDWRVAYEREVKRRKASDVARQLAEWKIKCIVLIKNAIIKHEVLGEIMTDDEQIKFYAEEIVNKDQVDKAKALGVDITFTYKEEEKG